MPASPRRESRVSLYLRALDLQAQEVARTLKVDASTISRKINPRDEFDEIDLIEVGRGIERALICREAG